MEQWTDLLGKGKRFSTIGVNSKYCRVEIKKGDQKKAAFTHHNLLCFVQMPFEFQKVPSTVQQTMDVVLLAVKWHLVLFYL